MKGLIYLFVFTALMGCQSPDEILIEDFQTYFNNEILQNMDDPKSYEMISTTIIDTTLYSEYWEQLLKMRADHESQFYKVWEEQYYSTEKTEQIFSITIQHNFRAKNIFGALVKESAEVSYFPNSPEPSKRFYIKSK